MSQPSNLRISAHHLLGTQAITWDINAVYQIPHRHKRLYAQPATKPPTRTMTLMVPGYASHLPPIELRSEYSQYITVSQVLDHIYHNLCVVDVDKETLRFRGEQNIHLARQMCIKRFGGGGPYNDGYFKKHIMNIDLLCGRTQFRGLSHQFDARGANVWVVILERRPIICSPLQMYRLHESLEPGRITWDLGTPPSNSSAITNNDEGWDDYTLIAPVTTYGNISDMRLSDLRGSMNIRISSSSADGKREQLTIKNVLHGIYTAMNVRYSDKEWPLWDSKSACARKRAFWAYQAVMAEQDIMEGTSNMQESDTTYLKSDLPQRQRFLGIWHDIDDEGIHLWTLLKQPSFRFIPALHAALQPGGFDWNVLDSWITTYANTALDEAATNPPRIAITITVDFMPGSPWTIEVYKSEFDDYVTVRKVFTSLHMYIVVEDFEINADKLPPHLLGELETRARSRGDWNELFHDYRRVDTLRKTYFNGLEHYIAERGEDGWKVLLI